MNCTLYRSQAQEDGDYIICFDNTFSVFSAKTGNEASDTKLN